MPETKRKSPNSDINSLAKRARVASNSLANEYLADSDRSTEERMLVRPIFSSLYAISKFGFDARKMPEKYIEKIHKFAEFATQTFEPTTFQVDEFVQKYCKQISQLSDDLKNKSTTLSETTNSPQKRKAPEPSSFVENDRK